MKTLGATAVNKHADQDNRGLKVLNLRLVYLCGDAASIGALGTFLVQCSKEMKDTQPFHRHFRDFLRGWDATMADVVVNRAEPKAKQQPGNLVKPSRRSVV